MNIHCVLAKRIVINQSHLTAIFSMVTQIVQSRRIMIQKIRTSGQTIIILPVLGHEVCEVKDLNIIRKIITLPKKILRVSLK